MAISSARLASSTASFSIAPHGQIGERELILDFLIGGETVFSYCASDPRYAALLSVAIRRHEQASRPLRPAT